MTDLKGIYWKRSKGVYLQPDVCEPPIDQNANNARHAIWHMGREIEMEVYPTLQGWRASDGDPIDDGRHDRGAPLIIPVRASIQPYGGEGRDSSKLMQMPEGQWTEGQVVVHLDSHEPFNIETAAQYSEVLPDGVRVIGPDTEAPDDRVNFPTVFRFRGRRWKAISVAEFFEGGDEELAFEGAIYRAICSEFKDRSHERNATPETAGEGFWGP